MLKPAPYAGYQALWATRAILLLQALLISFFAASQKPLPGLQLHPGGVTFTENKGQLCDQDSRPRPDVLYSAAGKGLAFYLKRNGISYQLNAFSPEPGSKSEKDMPGLIKSAKGTHDTYRVDFSWKDANPALKVEARDSVPGYDNYYLGACPGGALNVRSYASVLYKGLYPGIDLRYYDSGGNLKYDYLLAPGADYRRIGIEIKGATAIELVKGAVHIKTPLGDITEEAPVVSQGNRKLKAEWQLSGNVLRFAIKGHDPGLPMIIDPLVRLWGTYYGGYYADKGYACTTDSQGNIYMAGTTISSVNIATSGSHQNTFSGNTNQTDGFLAKFNSAGVRLWGTYYGGNYDDDARSCAVDNSGNVYIVGATLSPSAIASPGSYKTSISGTQDAFLAKFNSAGVRQWASYYGGTGDEGALGCALDVNGNIYFCGITNSSSGTSISTTGAHQFYFYGNWDAFLVKFNALGARQWGTYYGGTGFESGNGCCVDVNGNIYLAGDTQSGGSSSSNIITASSHQTAYGGGADGFLAKFNALGVRQWGTYYGGTGYEEGNSCSTDGAGNVYMVGQTQSTASGTVIATASAYQAAYGGGSSDAYVVKFTGSGVRQWGTYYGGTAVDAALGCTVDPGGNVYFTGYTRSTASNIIASSGGFQASYYGSLDNAMLVKLSTAGVRQWGTYYWGPSSSLGSGCCVDSDDRVYMTGETYNNTSSNNTGTIIASPGCQQAIMGGYIDAFLVSFGDCYTPAVPANASAPANQLICANRSTALLVSGNGVFKWYATPTSTTVLQAGPGFTTPVLSAGTYTYYAEASACSSSVSPSRAAITVTVTPNLAPQISISDGTICMGQSFTMVPSGAVSYTFSGGSAVVSPTYNTTYTIAGTGTNSCLNETVCSITVEAPPVISVAGGTVCAGGAFTISPSGAASYSFSGGQVVTPTITSTYSVSGINSLGCESAVSIVTVTAYALPVIAVSSGTLCLGNSFTLSPSGASAYFYSSTTAVVAPAVNTTYSVTGTSAQGCAASAPAFATVVVVPLPTVSVAGGTICAGDSFTISPSGASGYTISGGQAVVSPAISTSYSVTGTGNFGCLSAAPALCSVTVHPVPAISAAGGSVCAGQNFTIVPAGASSYSFSGGSAVVTPTLSTTYSVTGQSSFGCISGPLAVSVTVAALPVFAVASASICSGDSFTIVPSSTVSLSYSFSGGPVVSPAINTTYTVSGTDANGCTGVNACSVLVNSLPVLSAGDGTICTGQSFTLSCQGAASYTFPGLSPVVSPGTSTSYVIAGTDNNACTNTVQCTVIVNPLPLLSISPVSTLICAGESLSLTAGGANTYTWSNGSNGALLVLVASQSTVLTVTGTDLNACSQDFSLALTVDQCLGLDNGKMLVENGFRLYPNPSNGHFELTPGPGTEDAQLFVFDGLGRLAFSSNTLQTTTGFYMPVAAEGLYYYVIERNNRVLTTGKFSIVK